jgi:hypothetical protein
METITITRPVIVKVKVTDGYKKALAAEVQKRLADVESHLGQLNIQYNKVLELEKNNPQLQGGGLKHIDSERQKLTKTHRQLIEKLKEIGSLAEGQEVVHGRLESFVELKVGDSWSKIMTVEVVLQDDKVVEIRQGGLP